MNEAVTQPPNLIREAIIEVIKPHELKVGDHILWAQLECKVLQVSKDSRMSNREFVYIEQNPDEPNSAFWIPRYLTFYRIKSVLKREEGDDK